jgi:hypothetical protein
MADTNHGRPRNREPITDELNGTSWRTPRKASTSTRSLDAVAAVHQQSPSAGDVDSVRLDTELSPTLHARAYHEHRTDPDLIRDALRRHLETSQLTTTTAPNDATE